MFIPSEDEMREQYESYLAEIEMFGGEWGLKRALTYEEWCLDQKEFGYYAWEI